MSSGSSGLPVEVAAARADLTALLGRLDPAAAVHAPTPPARPTVALLGAPGRGRSALLTALLGLDEPPPVGPDGVRRAEPGVVPLLEELDLIVPPRPEPGSWLVEPSDQATAALVLADAAAPLGADELAALARVGERVDTVVLALTGIEAHRGWRTVVEADRALVASWVPRLAGAPWFPVSAALARRAGDPGLGDAAAEALRRRSGIADLQRELYRLVARRRRMLAEANALRTLAAGLDAVVRRAEATRSALRTAEPGDGVLARRDELLAARSTLRRDRHTHWRTALAAARVAAADDLAARLRELTARTRTRIDEADRAGLAAVPEGLAAEVEALATAVVEGLGARLRELVARTLADLVPPDEIDRLRVAEVAAPDASGAARSPTRARPAEDRLLVVAGASGGLGLSRLALLPLLAVPIAPAALGVALVPVSVGLGLGAAAWVARARRLAADRVHLRQWAAEALAEVRGDLDRVVADALITTEREVTLALDDALERRARDLDAALVASERAVRDQGADRAEELRAAARTVVEAREGRDRAEALLARLAALRDRVDVPEPPPPARAPT